MFIWLLRGNFVQMNIDHPLYIVIVFLMEIALITIPDLQFKDSSVFQEWFPKLSNCFVMNPLHFLIF